MSGDANERDSKQFSADVPNFFGPVSEAEVVRVRDILLCPTGGKGEVEEYKAHPPIASPLVRRTGMVPQLAFDLGRQLTIDRLPDVEADRVLAACTPRGHNFHPIKQFGQRYCFIREVDPKDLHDSFYGWDADGLIQHTLSLSRLVRDSAFSLQYTARVIDYSDGKQIIAWTMGSIGSQAFRVRKTRDWLSYDDGEDLRRLLDSYWEHRDVLPTRLTRAMWRAEYASSIRWGDVILPVLVSGLEALLKTDRHRATLQFKTRASALAAELGIDEITPAWCETTYDGRSDWVHGSQVKLFALDPQLGGGPVDPTTSEAFRTVTLTQDLLRAAIRRAIEDEAFRERFVQDDAVRTAWPVPGV